MVCDGRFWLRPENPGNGFGFLKLKCTEIYLKPFSISLLILILGFRHAFVFKK
jgi:hypothetical protein